MSALRYAVELGVYKVVARLQRVTVTPFREGANFIFQSICGGGEVRNDLLKYWIPGVFG